MLSQCLNRMMRGEISLNDYATGLVPRYCKRRSIEQLVVRSLGSAEVRDVEGSVRLHYPDHADNGNHVFS
jgi:hypothetical protein